MESLLFLGCLAAICVLAMWTVKNDKREDPLAARFGARTRAATKATNATAGEKAPGPSRFFRKR